MSHTAYEAYLETQVLTATPQKLRLMLVEGALRFGRQALECWGDDQLRSQRFACLARCNDIVTELFTSVHDDTAPGAAAVQGIYRFLLLQLARVGSQEDAGPLREILEILEEERETWRQVCERMPEAPWRAANQSGEAEEITATGLPAMQPQAPARLRDSDGAPSRFSLEA